MHWCQYSCQLLNHNRQNKVRQTSGSHRVLICFVDQDMPYTTASPDLDLTPIAPLEKQLQEA